MVLERVCLRNESLQWAALGREKRGKNPGWQRHIGDFAQLRFGDQEDAKMMEECPRGGVEAICDGMAFQAVPDAVVASECTQN